MPLPHLSGAQNKAAPPPQKKFVASQLVDGVEDIKRKYLSLIYVDQLAEEKKAEYWGTHADPASAHDRNGGAHFLYLSNLVKRNAGGAGWAVGGALSIAE